MKTVGRVITALALAGAVTWTLGAISPEAVSADEDKIGICHGTGSATQPYTFILVDRNAAAGHFNGSLPGHGDNNYPDLLLGSFPSNYHPNGSECSVF